MDYNEIFQKIWVDYHIMNPGVEKIHELLKSENENIVNDHVAFRTYDLPGINIDSLSSLFLDVGYEECNNYYFEKKKLRAKHYSIKGNDLAPKVFISELITSEFGELIQRTASEVASRIRKTGIIEKELLYIKNVWKPISYRKYLNLRKESEYAAWVYVFGFRANHFTIFVNYLKKYDSIEKLNQLLKKNGFELNSSGGEIKGSKEQMLRQSSTMADVIDVNFVEGLKKIPCCYYEFAERYSDSEGNLFSGFIAQSADKIFESTNFRR